MINQLLRFFLENRLVTTLLLVLLIGWGLVTAPFNWQIPGLPADPVPVDAIPNIGENQQIVYTPWPGRSPQDIEDQVSYPLTTYLLGIPGVKSVRSTSVFGFSSIYLIFNEEVEFYWSRSRILEKLNALPPGLLPEEVRPALGPDATALGQVFWYTLEGRDPDGNPTGGWDLHETRSVQDYYVKYGLSAVEGVAEVASVGGFVQEYQVDVDPKALQTYNIPLTRVVQAVRQSNQDVGAKTIEVNQAEYLVRGLGYLKESADLEQAVVTVQDNVPIRVKDVARVGLGPATRRGLLDKGGAEVTGGVVVARHGANPMEVIQQVKKKINEISSGLPAKTLANGVKSQLTIVPFYDRSGLINETLGTLQEALSLEVLITILVVIVLVQNLRASLLISSLLPVAILVVFIAMRYFGIEANIVALSGIAIAIGTMVDLGVILTENILNHLEEAPENESKLETVYRGAAEVSSAIITAVSTTIVSFIPVFALQQAEGKLFEPLAFTKTFALMASLLVTLFIIPSLAYALLGRKIKSPVRRKYADFTYIALGMGLLLTGFIWAGIMLLLFGVVMILKKYLAQANLPEKIKPFISRLDLVIAAIAITGVLAWYWLPLGASVSLFVNFLFVLGVVGGILGIFTLVQYHYSRILQWCLHHKKTFMVLPGTLLISGFMIWLGFNSVFGFIASGADALGINVRNTALWESLAETFPGLGEEFMPTLDEGSFLLMPTSMPHSGVAYNREMVGQLDRRVNAIPEVETVVGKMGRVESALDPAPISMFENVINYKPEYIVNEQGYRQRFRVNEKGEFITQSGDTLSNEAAIAAGITRQQLIPDGNGQYFRNWRKPVNSPDDIWNEIVRATQLPGVTSAPKLQPIETRLVMLQTGMRAPMGIKVYGPDLRTIERFGQQLEPILKEVPGVKKEAVFAERIVGKPYLELDINREQIARYGLSIAEVQQTIETAIGGKTITSTVEGRERYPVRVRYPRELRDRPEAIAEILQPTPTGAQVPLGQLVNLAYRRGPQAIKSEETFLTGYVLFDKTDGVSEVTAVENARSRIQREIEKGNLTVPAGVSYKFSGNYENQVRAEKRLSIVIPLVLAVVFIILYLQFRSVVTALIVFSGIALAFSGGFVLIGLYGNPDFLDVSVGARNLRDLFQIQPINLSVAVWVGFIALFGIATDDGVLMATYLDQRVKGKQPESLRGLHQAVIEAGTRRVRPAIITSVTTLIALLPVLTATGRGSDIMVPMAIPAFGGMLVAVISYFMVPVLYAWREELKLVNP